MIKMVIKKPKKFQHLQVEESMTEITQGLIMNLGDFLSMMYHVQVI